MNRGWNRLVWACIFLCMVNAYLIMALMQPEIQAASDRICVPLYDETGYECCERPNA